MIYSIGSVADLRELHWLSDWDSKDIFGEDYPYGFVVGLYQEKDIYEGLVVSYYIDLRDSTIMTIFFENEEDEYEDIETIWNERYFV